MKRRPATVFILGIFLVWNVMTYWFIAYRPQPKVEDGSLEIDKRLNEVQARIHQQALAHERLLSELQDVRERVQREAELLVEDRQAEQVPDDQLPGALPQDSIKDREKDEAISKEHIQAGIELPKKQLNPNNVTLPILVIACNRPSISRCLDQLFEYRPAELADRFPVIVSQDCGHKVTADTIRAYGDKVTLIQHPDLSDIPVPSNLKKFQGYYKIARHYKWALNQIFNVFEHNAVIIVEDDLNISSDFFEYFSATFPILHNDPSLWCVSAWNDNGKGDSISDEAELLYRTDFFPGLGWMLERKTWRELQSKWPETFWDDWMRHPDQRRERACIRPEISRTSTFGKIGVSKGQFFEKYLKFIKLNEQYVPFTKTDLSFLMKENYDENFTKMVYSSPLMTPSQVKAMDRPNEKVVRVEYKGKKDYKILAKDLGIMDDVKSGVPRAGYRGVVSFYRNGRRVFLAPPIPWTGYDPTWS